MAPAGSPRAAMGGLLRGAGFGLPVGFLLYMVLREFAMPTSLWSSDAIQWGVILATMVLLGGLGFWQGARPSRFGASLIAGMYGFLWGAVLGGVTGTALAMLLGAVFGASSQEGSFAMGVVFGVAPLAGMLGGLALAVREGRRAWGDWPG